MVLVDELGEALFARERGENEPRVAVLACLAGNAEEGAGEAATAMTVMTRARRRRSSFV